MTVVGSRRTAPAAIPDQSYPPTMAAWGVVGILFCLYALASLDRQIVALLITPIKQDLGLSDFEISLIQGSAFALFYSTFMLPIGWAVDRYSRRVIIFIGVIVWSLSAIACGLARTGLQLFGARATVGAGEAALTPSAYSIMAGLFPASRLVLPMAVFTMGGTLGAGFAFFVGGPLVQWLNGLGSVTAPIVGELKPWQMAFIITGAPGLLMAFLIFLVPEPKRAQCEPGAGAGYGAALSFMGRRWRYYLCHFLGFGLVHASIVGVSVWNAAFLTREHDWQPAEIGLWVGGIQMAGALLGMPLQGAIVDHLFHRGFHGVHLWWPLVMCLLGANCSVIGYTSASATVTLALFALFWTTMPPVMSVAAAGLQVVVAPALRGRINGIYMIVSGIFGVGVGPTMVAAITDFGFRDEARLGDAMAIASGSALLLAAVLFALARRPLRDVLSDTQPTFAAINETS